MTEAARMLEIFSVGMTGLLLKKDKQAAN